MVASRTEALMAEEFASKVVTQFTGEIASRLNRGSALATAVENLNSQGLSGHAFETLPQGLATKPINPHAAAASKVAPSLFDKGLVGEIRAKVDAPVWHENDDGRFAASAHSSAALKLMCRQTLAAATK